MTTILFSILFLVSTLQQVALASEQVSRTKDASTQTDVSHGLPQRTLDDQLKDAVREGHAAHYVEYLLHQKADPNCVKHTTKEYSLVLHAYAAKNETVVALLLKHGACSQEILNEDLRRAVEHGRDDAVKSLLDKKADLTDTSRFSQLLTIAAAQGRPVMTGLLLEHAPEKESLYDTALARTEIKFLQAVYAQTMHNKHCKEKELHEQYCVERGFAVVASRIDALKEILKMFKKKGADMNSTYKTAGTSEDKVFTIFHDRAISSISLSHLSPLYTVLYDQTEEGGIPNASNPEWSIYNEGKKIIEDFQKELLGEDAQKAKSADEQV